MESKRCPSCGAMITANKNKVQNCPYCGTEVVFEEEEKIENKSNKNKALFVLVAFVVVLGIVAGVILGTKDSNKQSTENTETTEEHQIYRLNDINNLRVNDHLLLGTFEQDNNINTKDEIEWEVVTNNGEQLTVVSCLGLDSVKYKDIDKWLEKFVEESFTDDEKKYIVEDYFLNDSEAILYFENDEDRICITTEYAISNGAHVYDETNKCWWWINTEDLTNGPFNVRTDGHIKYVDTDINADGYVIRPALIISTKPMEKKKENKEVAKKPIIEVLDTQMNVYTTVDKSSEKNGVVYKGDRFEVITYYETPGYKWYQIGTNQWLGDGNDTRIKLVSGKLQSKDVSVDQSKIVDDKNDTSRKQTLINKINGMSDYTFDNCYVSVWGGVNMIANDHLQEQFDNLGIINSISFNASLTYDTTVGQLVHLSIDDENKRVKLQANIYGEIPGENILEYTINNVYIYDKDGNSVTIEYPDDKLQSILTEVSYYQFSPGGSHYSKKADGLLYAMSVLVDEVYPDYELIENWSD